MSKTGTTVGQRRFEDELHRREEGIKVQTLIQDASNLRLSQQIREYVDAVRKKAIRTEGTITPGSELEQ